MLRTDDPDTKQYRFYLLRLWCCEPPDRCWQASLEDSRTGQRIGFATLEQLFTFLMDEAESGMKGVTME